MNNELSYNDNYRSTVAKNTRFYRIQRKLSQEELGRRIGKSLGWINKLENGNTVTKIDDAIIESIAYTLCIDKNWLLDNETHETINKISIYNPIIRLHLSEDIKDIADTVEDLKLLTDMQLKILKTALEFI